MEENFRSQMDASDNVSYYTGGRRASGGGASSGGYAAARRASAGGMSGGGPNPSNGPPLGRATTWDPNAQRDQQQQPHDEFSREQLLEHIINPYIEEDSPAALALRANAEVHIGKMSKVARSINAQALRRVVKRASMRNHFGKVRGKPPRVPPPSQMRDTAPDDAADMYGIEEGDYEEDEDGKYPGSGEFGHLSSSEERMDSKDSGLSKPESPSLSKVDSNDASIEKTQRKSKGKRSSREPASPKSRGKAEVKVSPAASNHDHLYNSMNAMKRSQPSMKQFAPDQDAKDIPDEVVDGTMEAGRKVMKSVDPHDILKLTRWRRKKIKGKQKKERKSYVKGKVIDGQHELYAQSIAVMLGVRTSIARTNGLITAEGHKKRWLVDEDFLKTEKYEFRPDGSEHTPPHQLSHTFKFKDYAPVVFAYLRRLFGINEFDFLLSVCGNANFIEFISNAKSGQFFFYSSDGKYMVKTMTTAESKFLRRILPDYFKHCCSNPNTMIAKFCGMYRVKLYHLRRNVKFVIMESVFFTDKPLQEFYDLKGSIHGRDASPGDQVLKDNDLRARLPDGALALAPELRDRVRRQLIRDCNFLQKKAIMDYSMLVGIHHIPPKSKDMDGSARMTSRASARRPSLARRPLASSGSSDNQSVSESNNNSSSGLSVSFSQKHNENIRRSIHEMQDNLGPPIAMFDDILDEDDSSYLEGSDNRPSRPGAAPAHIITTNNDIETKKAQTIEQIYWPFHRLHDIHGHRRMIPGPCFHCKSVPCQCKEDNQILKGYGIPNFVAPLSDRKDGGFMMDTNGLDMPMKYHNARTGEQLYEGKIFYLGVIDILQEYNSRKVVESRYRMLQGMDALEASCVAPRDYAARFVKFFDMYSIRVGKSARGVLSNFKKSTRTSAVYRATQLENELGSDVAAKLKNG